MKKVLKGLSVLEGQAMKPSIYLTTKELPDLKRWKVGKYYDIIIKVKQVSSGLTPDGKGMEGRFEIEQVKPYEDESGDD